MALSPVWEGGYYSSAISPYVDSYHRSLRNFEYLQIFVANNIIIILLEISCQLWHDPQLDCHKVLVATGLLESFRSLSPFVFLFSIRAYHPFIRNVRP